MACIIKVTFTLPKEGLVDSIKKEILEKKGFFEGDTTGGDFSVPSKYGLFVIAYSIYDDQITINVIKKPIIASCSRIEEELRKIISDYNPLAGINPISFNLDDSRLLKINKNNYFLENTNGKESGGDYELLMDKLLHSLDSFDIKESNMEIRIKKIILSVAGLFATDPEELYGNIELKGHLLYSSLEFSILHMRLNALLQETKPDSFITASDVNNCKTVNDCIKLVKTKTA